MAAQTNGPVLSVIPAVEDTPAAVEWYRRALGATVLWNMGLIAASVISRVMARRCVTSTAASNNPGRGCGTAKPSLGPCDHA
jgi:hypothetical protein